MAQKMSPADEASMIQALLYRLGATEAYTGFPYTVRAIQLCINDPRRLNCITTLIYLDIARQFDTTWTAVERNMRTLVSIIWERNPVLLTKLAGCPMERKPNNSRFLSILTFASRGKGA